jgi:large subunit ribosomal protein L22
MSKSAHQRRLRDNQAMAVARLLRVSPQKLNLLAQQIRGKAASQALAELQFSPKRMARDVRKVLQSAIANAENNHQLDVDRLQVVEASVGKGIIMKRFMPAGRGRSGILRKPFAQISIVVQERAEAGEKA